MVTVKWLSPSASWPAWPAWRWLSSTISSRVGLSAAFSLVRMRVAYSTMSCDFPAAEGAPLPDRPRHYGGAPPARESPLRPAGAKALIPVSSQILQGGKCALQPAWRRNVPAKRLGRRSGGGGLPHRCVAAADACQRPRGYPYSSDEP